MARRQKATRAEAQTCYHIDAIALQLAVSLYTDNILVLKTEMQLTETLRSSLLLIGVVLRATLARCPQRVRLT